MSSVQHRTTLESVPKQFVSSLRVLFDILDEQKTGFVKLGDIETRWKEEGTNGLPVGVVEALRKVTPASGKLTFERFVAGLKIALLRTKVGGDEPRKGNDLTASLVGRSSNTQIQQPLSQAQGQGQSHPPPSSTSQRDPYSTSQQGFQPYVGNHHDARRMYRPEAQAPHDKPQQYPSSHRVQNQQPKQHGPVTAAVRPNNAVPLAQNRTKSMPLLGSGNENIPPVSHSNYRDREGPDPPHDHISSIPARPTLRHESVSAPRLGWPESQPLTPNEAILSQSQGKNKDEIVNALKKWQRDRMVGEEGPAQDQDAKNRFVSGSFVDSRRPLSIATTSLSSAFEQFGNGAPLPTNGEGLSAQAQRRANRRKEPRRHTLSNGVDFHMIKRMKQLEHEKDILVQGLESVERAREWYINQLREVEDKQKYIGQSSSQHDYSVEAHQERMNFKQARIYEVNQQLKALVESSEKGFPLHMNLALSLPLTKQRPENTETSNIVAMLKGQNRLLTQEVSQKSDKISQLEREKATLIRDLFDSRSKTRNNNYEDSTFM